LLLKTVDETGRVKSEPLLVTARPIIGFGVSVHALHQPVRSIDVVKLEADGSLSLAHYSFSTL